MTDEGPSAPGTRRAPRADAGLVRALLRDQHPDLAELPLRRGPSGWDNAHWLLGDELAVRIPRRALAAELVRHEARWLPEIAPRLPLAVPVPARTGVPGHGWPWHFTVVPWWHGTTRLDDLADVPAGVGEQLAAFLRALHVPAPDDAPHNPYRSVPLTEREESFRAALAELRRWERSERLPGGCTGADLDALERAVADGLTAGRSRARVWLHGDLHPGNVLVRDGRVTAVVDWGDVCAGHPEADLAVRWWSLPVAQHAGFVAALPDVDPATWRRAAAWAATIAAFLLTQAPRAGDDRLLGTALRTCRRLAAPPPA